MSDSVSELPADFVFLNMMSKVISHYVASQTLAPQELPLLIQEVYGCLRRLADAEPAISSAPPPPTPAVPIRKSVTPNYIVCLEDGLTFRMMKRHLWSVYKMTPDDYREKWKLPPDYPMVAPAYSARRSDLAKTFKLGTTNRGKGKRTPRS